MNISIKNEHVKNLTIISIAYLLTHGLILITTGIWWDEHTWAFDTDAEMWETSLELGKPSTYFLMKFIFGIPEFAARVVIFLCFYISTIGIYYIYNHLPYINAKYALWLTLIYNAIPANDARIMRGVFPYTFGYLMFIMAFCALIILIKKSDDILHPKISLRMLTLLLFACSFVLNSNLVFYALPLLYLCAKLLQNTTFKYFYRYLDFLLLPICFFMIKVSAFPSYGRYAGYNKVSLFGLVHGLLQTIPVCIERIIQALYLWCHHNAYILAIVAVVLASSILYRCFITRKHRLTTDTVTNEKYNSLLLAVKGLIVMYFGAFAYIVVGQTCYLYGVNSRSSMLLPFGMAMVFLSIIIYSFGNKISKYVVLVCAISGFFSFNYYYLSYQQDWYRQKDFMYELSLNKALLDDRYNILYITNSETIIDATTFYSLNSNAHEIFGKQDHFFMKDKQDIKYLEKENISKMMTFVQYSDYNMLDYLMGRSSQIEAIVVYDNDISLKNTLLLKMYEICDKDKFEQTVYSGKNLVVYTPQMPEYNDKIAELGIVDYF